MRIRFAAALWTLVPASLLGSPVMADFGSPTEPVAVSTSIQLSFSANSPTTFPPSSLVQIVPESEAQPLEGNQSSNNGLKSGADWPLRDSDEMAKQLRAALDALGVAPDLLDQAAESFLIGVQRDDIEPLNAWVDAASEQFDVLSELMSRLNADLLSTARSMDPSGPDYALVESMPNELRAALRTWIGRELVRARYYDEALPIFAEVDPMVCPDPATLLFYRGACYHAQLKIKDALSDLRRLLQRKDQIPARYARTAEMMVADIKPLKKDSLDEISRLMSDVTRRLDLGRADEATQEREQEVIDKLTKLIDKIEEEQQKQQQQQQQQQNASGNGGKSDGQSSPMDDSRIAGANGQGDVDRKKIDDQNGWGNLPPAERQESLQQISRDLPTHYREAIEAYFRKLATQK
jgi:tetratricopeptide (TPR) repeat protein